MAGHFNQPVVVKGKSILQGQFAGVRMSLGIEDEEHREWRDGKRRKKKKRVKDKREGNMEVEGERRKERERGKKKHKSVSGISLCGCLTDPNKSVARQRASSGAMQGSWWH